MLDFIGAIFDLDGTLLDSMPVWENVAFDYLISRGVRPGGDVRDAVRAMSIQQACKLFSDEYGLPSTEEEIIAGVNGLIEDFYLNRVTLKPGVMKTLDYLRSRGVKLCVATATDRYLAEGAMRRTGILPCFDGIVTCTEAGAGKDRPDIFFKALSLLGTEKSETVVFEDSLYAIRTAKDAGFRVAALFDEAARPHRKEIKRLADAYFRSFDKWYERNAH